MQAHSGTLSRILKNAGWLFAGKGFGAVLSLAYIGIATRTLGIENFGQFALILSVAQSLGTLVAFQTWQIVVRFGMEHLQAGREKELRELIGLSILLDVGGAMVGCLIAAIGIQALGRHLGWTAAFQADALLFIFVMLLSVRSTAVGILRLYDGFRTSAAADAVTPIVRLLGALVVLTTDRSVTAFLIAWAAAEVATALSCWVLAARTARGIISLPTIATVKRALGANHGISSFAATTNVSYSLDAVAKQFSTVIVGLFVGPSAAGQYRLALQLAQGFAKLSDLLSRAVYAELVRVRVGQGAESLRKLFRQSMRFSMVGATVIVILLVLLAKPALALVAGPEFAPAYPLLILLGIAAALDFGGVNFEPALLATSKVKVILAIRVSIVCLLAVMLFMLLPTMGSRGAAVAALTSSALGLVLFGVAAWRAVHKAVGVELARPDDRAASTSQEGP